MKQNHSQFSLDTSNGDIFENGQYCGHNGGLTRLVNQAAALQAREAELRSALEKFVQLVNASGFALTEEQIQAAQRALVEHCHDARAVLGQTLDGQARPRETIATRY